MSKHIESVVPRLPVRDADKKPAPRAADLTPSPARTTAPLLPVHRIPGLRPEERVEELRQRVRSGVYSRAAVVEQVAEAMRARGI